MSIDTQKILENEELLLYPLKEIDFDALYQVAKDPLIWEQHPNKDRWKREVFQNFFEGAIQSKGAYKIVDKATQELLGCTRVYDYQVDKNLILIGYTFFARHCWGKSINSKVKHLLLNYLFNSVATVEFHIGAENKRSQIAIERLGAKKVGVLDLAYYGEAKKLNFVYQIQKSDWIIK